MVLTPTHWDEHLKTHRGHLLQSWAWGELKSRFGWTALRLRVAEAAAQILFRRLPFGLTIAYVPKGPILDWSDSLQCQALFSIIHAEAQKRRAVFLKVEPDLWSVADCPGAAGQPPELPSKRSQVAIDFLQEAGFVLADAIQPRTSLMVDISGPEEMILAAMKQKTRYNIRLAEKKGVTVRRGSPDDLVTFHRLALTTAERNDFGVHSLDYYQTAYSLFSPDRCALLLAEFEAKPLAALLVFRHSEEAYYFYGASANEHRRLMAPYLIQWRAMNWAKSRGCTHYDLWGIPEAGPARLEAEFPHRHDGLWGVYRFKRGFGGRWRQSIGAYDYVYSSALYKLYKLRRQLGQQMA